MNTKKYNWTTHGMEPDVKGKWVLLSDMEKEPALSADWLQSTKEGRYILNAISFPLANHFKTHPEKIPIELVLELIKAMEEYRNL